MCTQCSGLYAQTLYSHAIYHCMKLKAALLINTRYHLFHVLRFSFNTSEDVGPIPRRGLYDGVILKLQSLQSLRCARHIHNYISNLEIFCSIL